MIMLWEPEVWSHTMLHCNEHLQAKKRGQKVYCGTYSDALQLPQEIVFFDVGGYQGGGKMQGRKEIGGIRVHDGKFTKNQ